MDSTPQPESTSTLPTAEDPSTASMEPETMPATQEMFASQELTQSQTNEEAAPVDDAPENDAGEAAMEEEKEETAAPAAPAAEYNPEAAMWSQVEGLSGAFPMARVKKIIKADPDVKTVNKEATLLIAKTTELVVMKLAEQSLQAAYRGKRKTIGYNDVCTAIQTHDEFEFLEGTIRPGATETKLRGKNASATNTTNGAASVVPAVGEKRALPEEFPEEEDSGPKQMKMEQMFAAQGAAPTNDQENVEIDQAVASPAAPIMQE